MGHLLPTFFVAAAGTCLVLVLVALWHSLRVVLDDTQQGRGPRMSLDAAQQALVREKDTLLAAIRELRFEHELGKVGDADLQRFEQRYRTRAREVLRLLDEQLEPHREKASALIAKAIGEAPSAKAIGETSIANTDAAPAPSGSSTAPALRGGADSATAERARATCPSCSTSNEPDAVFCKKCGTRLQAETSS